MEFATIFSPLDEAALLFGRMEVMIGRAGSLYRLGSRAWTN